MKILLDSHVFMWSLNKPRKLGSVTRRLLENNEEVYVSTVSLWELAIKHAKGKFSHAPESLLETLAPMRYRLLTLRPEHVVTYRTITQVHKDPFDRMLLAQALSDSSTFLTADKTLLQLDLPFVTNATK